MAERLGFVIPWYGRDISGGAEAECRATALALARHGVEVEILTTCALDHASDWVNYHPEGVTEEEGLTVRRFKVRARHAARYWQLNTRLLMGGALSRLEEEEFIRESIHSDDLYAFLGAERDRYWYCFIPYLFGTTLEGALVAPERSLLIPCLHDGPYAYLRRLREILARLRAVLFHTPAELALARRLAGDGGGAFYLVGEGVNTAITGIAERFRRKYRIGNPFVISVGRKAKEKNTPLLVEYFARYQFTHPGSPLRLLLVGGGYVKIPIRLFGVLDLHYLPTQDMYDACAAAVALCQPSLRESFSLVLMEAWLCGAPVLVHADCPVTVEHCLASNGGLAFADYFEFAEAVELLLADPALRPRLAANGRRYVLERYHWDVVTANFLGVFETLGARLAA